MGIHVELVQAIPTPITREKLWSALAYALALHRLLDRAGLVKDPTIVAVQVFGSVVSSETVEYRLFHLPQPHYEKLTHPALLGYFVEEWNSLLRSRHGRSRIITRYTDAQLIVHWTASCLGYECEGATIARAPRAPHAKTHGHVEVETMYIHGCKHHEIKHLVRESVEDVEAHATILGDLLETLLKAYERPLEVYTSTSRRTDVAYYLDLRHPTRIVVGDRIALADSYAVAFSTIRYLVDTYIPVLEARVATGQASDPETKLVKLFRYIKKRELKPILASEEVRESIVQTLARETLYATAGSIVVVDRKPLQHTAKPVAQTLYSRLRELAEEAEVLEKKISELEKRIKKRL